MWCVWPGNRSRLTSRLFPAPINPVRALGYSLCDGIRLAVSHPPRLVKARIASDACLPGRASEPAVSNCAGLVDTRVAATTITCRPGLVQTRVAATTVSCGSGLVNAAVTLSSQSRCRTHKKNGN